MINSNCGLGERFIPWTTKKTTKWALDQNKPAYFLKAKMTNWSYHNFSHNTKIQESLEKTMLRNLEASGKEEDST